MVGLIVPVLQVYVLAPDALRVTVDPAHKVEEPEINIVGAPPDEEILTVCTIEHKLASVTMQV
jgi:hypothetical protein